MEDLNSKLAEMHAEVIDQVLDDLRNGDRKARAEALMLLKQNNVTAVATGNSSLSKLAKKLDFSSMEEKVVPFRNPRATSELPRKPSH